MIIYISTIGRYVRAFEFGQCIPSTSTGILLPQLSSGFGETLPVAFASWVPPRPSQQAANFNLASPDCVVFCAVMRGVLHML